MKRQATLLAVIFAVVSLGLFPGGAGAATPKPKYGPEAKVLSLDHEYFRMHPAPDYWALIPYYLPQQDDHSCSLASVAMVVNAARAGRSLTADDELATQPGLLKRVTGDIWKKGLAEGGHGVTLDQLKPLIEESLKAYGVEGASVEVFHADSTSEKSLEDLRKVLVENERSSKDFIVANFIQGVYTGDADAGHIAPVAAYDAAKRRVLVLDPDRQWYEPYWVSDKTFLAGMATADKESGKARGYVRIKIR